MISISQDARPRALRAERVSVTTVVLSPAEATSRPARSAQVPAGVTQSGSGDRAAVNSPRGRPPPDPTLVRAHR
ncbi:hypothetical protein [Actinoplanes sp. G11-F43]|uniref:hypothetical protein n=1 Tax=Actinoplanes sp. G11-F43 TaxID=3424130 RepID=UPI003D342799